MPSLARVRLRLTLWYAAIFVSILGSLGGGLFLAVRHRVSRQLDASLRSATAAVIEAARIREAELARARGVVVADALDELHIPDRALYLLDGAGRPIKPAAAAPWIQAAAREAARDGAAHQDLDTPDDRVVRLHAERFTGADGRTYVAAVVADRLELEDEYASVIETFGAAALAALLLVASGGYLLVRQATAPIEQSMEQMRRFMADAAHELRTPITLLRTRAEVALGRPRDPGRDAATLQAVEREAGRLGAIVGDLLTLARADAGERPVTRDLLHLDDVAADAVERARALAERKRLRLAIGDFEEAPITGDAALIRQLLLIVLDNAVKFTPAGGSVRLDVRTGDGRAAAVVTDSGVGISPAQLPHVCERFYRGDGARHEAEGAGLGLAIARWIAEAHGGGIDIRSQPGAGTTVTMTFPLAQRSARPRGPAPAANRHQQRGDGE